MNILVKLRQSIPGFNQLEKKAFMIMHKNQIPVKNSLPRYLPALELVKLNVMHNSI